MSAKANNFKLGLFILIAVGLGVCGVLVLGAARLFERKVIIETYLVQSVQGIDVGSKVKYRGVTIGHVRSIGFARNHYTTGDTNQNQHSYVVLELELKTVPFGAMTMESLKENLPSEVRHGLRARLTAQGVTGISYIEIDYLDPERYPPLTIGWEPEHPYLPSAGSALAQIVSSAEAVFSELERIDFERIANSVEKVIALLDRKIQELPVSNLSTNALALLGEVRSSNRHLQELLTRPEINSAVQDLSGTLASLRRTAESPSFTNSVVRLEQILRRVEQLVANKDRDLEASLDNLRGLTENLRELSENAKRFPAQLLFGQPPKPISPNP